jgi:hypothetical protein
MKLRLLIIAMAPVSLIACGGAQDNVDTKFRESFVKQCNEGATKTGVESDLAVKVCDCSADIVMKEYDQTERLLLNGRPQEVDRILDRCLAQVQAKG